MTNAASWLLQCNPRLAQLITDTLGSEHWLVNLKQIAELLPMAENAEFRKEFRDIKIENKTRVGYGKQNGADRLAGRCSPVRVGHHRRHQHSVHLPD